MKLKMYLAHLHKKYRKRNSLSGYSKVKRGKKGETAIQTEDYARTSIEEFILYLTIVARK